MYGLQLTEKELFEIGFEKCKSEADNMNKEKVFYKIQTLNGFFYFNPNRQTHSWYHKTIIGEFANDVGLDISKKPELFVLLSCFKCDFNIVG